MSWVFEDKTWLEAFASESQAQLELKSEATTLCVVAFAYSGPDKIVWIDI